MSAAVIAAARAAIRARAPLVAAVVVGWWGVSGALAASGRLAYNIDIATGAIALVVGLLARQGRAPRAALWAWNVLGIVALVIIVVIAILTSPMVAFFGATPEHLNTWVTRVPYVWLPAILAAVAVASHVVITRALLKQAHT